MIDDTAANIAESILQVWLTENFDEATSFQECIDDGRVNEETVTMLITQGVLHGLTHR